ncbi:MAG TPA: acyl carrier protein [Solirubrobacteraceae bacterium]|jgi:acyl carrier protein|nr:acyl carrier protein [Solirubrobacteraceae bacterium]
MFRRKKATARIDGPLTEAALREWLTEHLAARIEARAEEIDTGKTFEEYGLDSRVAVQVSGLLEKIVQRRLSPGLLYEHQTIDDLSRFLAGELHLA